MEVKSSGPASLPPVFRVEYIQATDDIVADMSERFQHGAQEGHLLIVDPSEFGIDGTTSDESGSGLAATAALLLEPEFDREAWGEMAIVAAVSVGETLASRVSPMIQLTYGWPDRILLNNSTVARVDLSMIEHRARSGLVVEISVQIESGDWAIASDPEGIRSIDPTAPSGVDDYIDHIARHFLLNINTWADRGFPAVWKRWLRYAHEDKHAVFQNDGGLRSGLSTTNPVETLNSWFKIRP